MNLQLSRITLTLLRASGYMFATLLWLWLVVLLIPALLDSGSLSFLLPQDVPEPAITAAANDSSSPLLLAAGAVVTLVMIIISILVVVRLPSEVAKRGEMVTRAASELVVPVITHHKPLSSKKKRSITVRVQFYSKLALVLIPFIASMYIPAVDGISQSLIRFISGILALTSLVMFSLEHALWRFSPGLTHAQRRLS